MRALKNSQANTIKANTIKPPARNAVARWHTIRPAEIGQDRI
jgi:hypothetical protein